MDDLETWMELAVEQHKSGNLELAEPLYRRILFSNPANADVQYLLGTLLLQKGNFTACIESLAPLALNRPEVADIHNNLGIAYHSSGRLDEATRAFRQAIEVRPDYDQAHFNLGVLLEQRGELSQAEHCYRQAIEINHDDAQVLCNLGHVLKQLRRWEDAEDAYSKLLSLRPEDIEVAVNLAFVLVKQERLDEAEETYKQILLGEPDFAEIHNNLSFVHERQGRLDEAATRAQLAIDLKPEYPEAFNNLGTALRSMHRLEEASAAFRRASELKPNFFLAEFNYGTTRLLAGDFAAGWPGYEQRARTLDIPPPQFVEPRWDGRPLAGKRLLIHAEQGFGDTIQFLRYLPQVKAVSGAHVVLQCPVELGRLVSGCPGVDELSNHGDAPCAAQCPLPSLPALFQTTLPMIPAAIPYLISAPELRSEWGSRLDRRAWGGFRIGIGWQGNPRHALDRQRSCSPGHFASLAELSDVMLVSLQKEQLEAESSSRLPASIRVLDLGPELVDFADSAAVLAQLDLVITVDSALAHLAGALGKPTWVLLPFAPDWRWMLERTDSPWYPTMRLFRQPATGDWGQVFVEVHSALQELLTTRAGISDNSRAGTNPNA